MRLSVFLTSIAAVAGSMMVGPAPNPAYAVQDGVVGQSLILTDSSGIAQLNRIKPGGQFIVIMSAINTAATLQEYVAVLEVRDENGYTIFLSLSEGVLGPGQHVENSTPVRLEEAGDYTLRSFVYSMPAFGAANQSITISSPVTSSISVQEIDRPHHQTGLLVPLFEYPLPDKPEGMWKALAGTKSAHPSVPVAVVINPSSGPGSWQDPNYVRGTSELRESGVEYVLGYVATDYASSASGSTLIDIKAMIDKYRSWYPDVNGILLDEVNSGTGKLEFYSELVSYARNVGFEYVVANPGTMIAEQYLGMFDILIIYENRVRPSVPQLQENTYYPNYNPEKFGFLVKNVPSLDSLYVGELSQYIGFLYLTSDIETALDPNPYNTLPDYFDDLVSILDNSVG